MSTTRTRRTPVILTVVGVIVVAALAAVLGVLFLDDDKDKDSSGDRTGPTRTTPKAPIRTGLDLAAITAAAQPDGTIRVGRDEAPVTVTVYEDFRCPFCERFEKNMGPLLADYAEAGKIKIDYHIASFLDGKLGGNGSVKAANAARCSVDAGKFTAYHSVLFGNQPDESTDGYTTARLLELADQVPGLRGPAFDACVNTAANAQWVADSETAFEKSGVSSTPSVAVDGKVVPSGNSAMRSADNLRELLDQRLENPGSGKAALGTQPQAPSAG
ncbi:thioredoxin domain-containing protein [Streptomyces sp. SID3343]|uniref:DsbA family protein n=1 Tax=Streptomyces sp. SID3343 TaxID=2690260 RepID=UPI00136D3304|nr:thioredoxin domain-containing protein [Streptomyces sp. SID3343]MYW02747.1 thioredoxin domain-containing protein [Streptomyces sp. SID3343]